MKNDVRAELERPLEDRRRERVVDDERRPSFLGDARDGPDIRESEERIRGRLQPDHLRSLGHGGDEPVGSSQVGEGRVDTHRGEDGAEDPMRSAVDVVAAHDVVPRAERMK